MIDVFDLWAFIRDGGVPAIVFLALLASMQGRFVWRREHDALEQRRQDESKSYEARLAKAEQERDRWEQAFMRVAGVAESVTELATARPPAARERPR